MLKLFLFVLFTMFLAVLFSFLGGMVAYVFPQIIGLGLTIAVWGGAFFCSYKTLY